MNKTKRYAYVTPFGPSIVLEVPTPIMGDESGFIPPPQIDFWHNREPITFTYGGEEDPKGRKR